jgi:hypothetical protein
MESMRGSITLQSAGVNQGTAVMISLPIAQQSNSYFDNPDLVMEQGNFKGYE